MLSLSENLAWFEWYWPVTSSQSLSPRWKPMYSFHAVTSMWALSAHFWNLAWLNNLVNITRIQMGSGCGVKTEILVISRLHVVQSKILLPMSRMTTWSMLDLYLHWVTLQWHARLPLDHKLLTGWDGMLFWHSYTIRKDAHQHLRKELCYGACIGRQGSTSIISIVVRIANRNIVHIIYHVRWEGSPGWLLREKNALWIKPEIRRRVRVWDCCWTISL